MSQSSMMLTEKEQLRGLVVHLLQEAGFNEDDAEAAVATPEDVVALYDHLVEGKR